VTKIISLTEQRILLFSVFVLSLCGIIYELVLGSLASYLLGNPVQQYSITIGFFLSSMGLGSYLSRYIKKDLIKNFIFIEIALGFVGGVSVLVLNLLFSFSASFIALQIFFLILIGSLVGLEIPLLTRILKKYGALNEILSNVLTLDYMGGLAGSLLFPLLLFPFAGRLLTSLIVGIINILIAIIIIFKINYSGKKRTHYFIPFIFIAMLAFFVFSSNVITQTVQKRLYYDDVIFSKRTKFQQIILTRNDNDFRLYLDGSLQFSTVDEYRYHEMLIFPSLSMINKKKDVSVLVLGGGDGIAVREILRDKRVAHVELVELDKEMINLAKRNPSFLHINEGSLLDKRVRVIVGDAYAFLMKNHKKFDVIIADFPDPHGEAIAKLYTKEFYFLVKKSLALNGVLVSQSTSPLFAREAFWCINETLKQAFRVVIPYHVFIPTFGDWGYNIATNKKIVGNGIVYKKQKGKYFSPNAFLDARFFPKDSEKIPTSVNTFNKPILYKYYLKGWQHSDY